MQSRAKSAMHIGNQRIVYPLQSQWIYCSHFVSQTPGVNCALVSCIIMSTFMTRRIFCVCSGKSIDIVLLRSADLLPVCSISWIENYFLFQGRRWQINESSVKFLSVLTFYVVIVVSDWPYYTKNIKSLCFVRLFKTKPLSAKFGVHLNTLPNWP